MSITIECPKCRGAMKRGFLVDRGDYNAKLLGLWVEGEPEKSYWVGGFKTKDKDNFTVATTYRCASCGYLESYAT